MVKKVQLMGNKVRGDENKGGVIESKEESDME